MENKELEEIVSKITSDVNDLNNFRVEAKKNEEDLFGISKDIYAVLKNNKTSISSLTDNIGDLKDAQNLLQTQFKESKIKNELFQESLNDIRSKQQSIEKTVTNLNFSLESFRNNINYRLNSFYTSLENKIISESRRQSLTSTPTEQKFAPPQPMQEGPRAGTSGGGKGGGGIGSAAASAVSGAASAIGGTAAATFGVAAGAVGLKGAEYLYNQAANPNPNAAPPGTPAPAGSVAQPPISKPAATSQPPSPDAAPNSPVGVAGRPIDRTQFMEQLKDPKTMAAFAGRMQTEVGSQGRAAQIAWAETTFNRAAARGQTLLQAVTGSYFPTPNPGSSNNSTFHQIIREVAEKGTNTTNGATGNASGMVGFGQGRAQKQADGTIFAPGQTASFGGERYGVEAADKKWTPKYLEIPAASQEKNVKPSTLTPEQSTTPPNIPSIGPQEQKERPYRIQGQAILPATTNFQETSYSAVTGGRGRGSMAYGSHQLYEQQGGAGSVIRNYLSGINDPTGSKNVVFNVGSPGGVMADPKVGTRTEIQIHMGSTNDINKLVSSGCLAIPPNEYPKFVAHLKEMIKEKGSASLAISPSAPGEPHKFRFLSPEDINKSKMQKLSAEEAVSNFKTTGDIDRKPQDTRLVASNDQAYKMVRDAAVKAGSPNPDLTASIAMMESGWLKKGIYARGTNNPFGQTGVGSAGFVVGADGQKHKAYGTLDEAVQDHLKRWGKYYQGDAQQTLGNLVKGGYNTVNGNWAPSILSTYNKQAGQPQLPQTQTPYPIQNLGQSDSTSEKKLMFSEPRIEKQAQNLSPETTQAANRLRQLQEYTITSTTGGQHAAGSQHYAHNNPEGTGGRAIDIRIRDMNTQQRQQLLENARRAGFNRIGISGDHLHADLGPGPFKVFDEGGGARAFGISAGEAQKRLSGIEVGVPSQQQAGPPGAQKQDNRMAFSFSTEKPLDVAETIKKSGLKPGQNIIGVDVQQDERGQYKSPEHLKTMQEAEKAGAKVHLYHQGPGMKEFGESSKGWEENLKQMLSKNRNAYSYEVDNLDQFGTPDKQLQFIRSLHEWQKQNNLSQKITLKNANVDLMKKIGETKDLDRNLFSQFQIQEQNTGRGTGGESAQEVAKRNEAGKQLNLTPVVTGNTNQYEQRNPVIAEGGGQQPSGEVRQPPVPNTAQGLTPPAPQNQKAPEEQKSEPPPTHEHGSSSNDYERASRQSSAPQNSMGAAGASINPLAQTPGSHFALYGGGIMV